MKNKNKALGVALATVAMIGTASADAGADVVTQLTTTLGYATTIVPAGLLIWGTIWGVRKLKAMGAASS